VGLAEVESELLEGGRESFGEEGHDSQKMEKERMIED
jgi:hypothetical protein